MVDGPFVAFVIGVESNAAAPAVIEALRPYVDRIVQLPSLGHFRSLPGRALVIRFGQGSQIVDSIAFASRNGKAAYLAYVADDVSAPDLRKLLATGSGDWLPSSSAAAEIADLCERLLGGSVDRSSPSKRATLVAFLPAGGGVGNTTLAIEVAVAHASRQARRQEPATCVLDLSGPLGTACDLLDVSPHLDLPVVAAAPRQLDLTMLESFRSRSSHGVDIYAAPKCAPKPDAPLQPAINAIIDLLMQLYGRIHVDLGPELGPPARDVLRRSDVVFLTTEFSVPAARRVAALKSDLGVMATERQAVIVNRYAGGRPRAGLTRADFERATTCLRFLTIGAAGDFAHECANIGVPMLIENARHDVCREIQAIEQFIEPIAVAPQSWLRRLLGAANPLLAVKAAL